MNIVIRVDASIRMGSGHVMRCLTLADELRKHNCEVAFVCRKFEGNLISFIETKGYTVFVLEQPDVQIVNPINVDPPHAKWLEVSWRHDAEETSLLLKTKWIDVDWMIVDHYALDYRWHHFFRQYAKKIMIIDDLADRTLDCDLLLDQTYGCKESDYRNLVPKECSLLLGSKYALLRPQFAQNREKAIERRDMTESVCRILVCLGGSDPDNITDVVLKGLEQVSWRNTVVVDVVLGSNAHCLAEVKDNASNSALPVNVFSNVNNMAELILRADLAIGAGGTMSWERCCLGLPTFTLVIANNQQKVVEGLGAAGAVMSLDSSSLISPEEIKDGVENMISHNEIYQKLITNAFAITDGLGREKVAQTIVKKCFKVTLRAAVPEDCELIFQWQSNPDIRRFCRNQDSPTWEEHQEWFYEGLQNKKRELFIVERSGESAGLLKLDVIEESTDTFEISILTAQDWQGKGVAIGTLRLLRHQRPTFTFIAEILKGNTASKKLFFSAGFKNIGGTWYINRPNIDR